MPTEFELQVADGIKPKMSTNLIEDVKSDKPLRSNSDIISDTQYEILKDNGSIKGEDDTQTININIMNESIVDSIVIPSTQDQIHQGDNVDNFEDKSLISDTTNQISSIQDDSNNETINKSGQELNVSAQNQIEQQEILPATQDMFESMEDNIFVNTSENNVEELTIDSSITKEEHVPRDSKNLNENPVSSKDEHLFIQPISSHSRSMCVSTAATDITDVRLNKTASGALAILDETVEEISKLPAVYVTNINDTDNSSLCYGSEMSFNQTEMTVDNDDVASNDTKINESIKETVHEIEESISAKNNLKKDNETILNQDCTIKPDIKNMTSNMFDESQTTGIEYNDNMILPSISDNDETNEKDTVLKSDVILASTSNNDVVKVDSISSKSEMSSIKSVQLDIENRESICTSEDISVFDNKTHVEDQLESINTQNESIEDSVFGDKTEGINHLKSITVEKESIEDKLDIDDKTRSTNHLSKTGKF